MSTQPIYQEIQNRILARIDAGVYPAGQKLPSDYALAETFQCSRLTIRKAMEGLIQQQRIVKHPGKGNYVMQLAKIQSGANGLQSFSERAQLEQKTAQTTVLQVEESTTVPDKIKQLFSESEDIPMVHLVRLRSLDHEPMTLENIYLPSLQLSAEKETFDFSGSLYEAIEKKQPIGYAQQEIEAIKCPASIARLLSIAENDPVLLLRAMTYAANGIPVMYETSYYRGDKYTFKQINSRRTWKE